MYIFVYVYDEMMGDQVTHVTARQYPEAHISNHTSDSNSSILNVGSTCRGSTLKFNLKYI